MRQLWTRLNDSHMSFSQKKTAFVGITTAFWTAVAFIVCLLAGCISGSLGETWKFVTFIVAGYTAVIMGFFRSVFYLFRKV